MMRPNGFTLIELLVAMTAGALLLSSLSWIVMQLSRQSKQAVSAQSEKQLSAALERVRSLLEGARAGPPDTIDLSDRRLSFVTNPPMALGSVGLVDAELRIVRSGKDEELDLTLHDKDGADLLGGKPNRLLDGQKSIRFSWEGSASGDRKYPSLITLTVIDHANRETDLIVPLVITGDPTCTFDPVSLACR